MKYTSTTKQGAVHTFNINAVAETYQQAYSVVTKQILETETVAA